MTTAQKRLHLAPMLDRDKACVVVGLRAWSGCQPTTQEERRGMMPMERILVVDDDVEVRALCVRALTREGYDAIAARDGTEALERAMEVRPSMAVVDVVMPGLTGHEFCQTVRGTHELAEMPILFLTGKDDITDKAAGFAVGGDDYLTKPFDIRELVMRVKALLRRATAEKPKYRVRELQVGELVLDRGSFTMTTPKATVPLTPTEFELLAHLMTHPGWVFSAEQLLEEVWGYPTGSTNTDLVRAHVKNIREKIEPDPTNPRYLRTMRAHGYSIVAERED